MTRTIYLDHAATAGWRPDEVGAAMLEALAHPGNPGRSGHRRSLDAARLVDDARHELAGLLGAADPATVAFTRNATEAINLVLHGRLRPGDRVLCSAWEHNAAMRPLRHLDSVLGLDLRIIPPSAAGPLDLDRLAEELRDGGVSLVAMPDASNVTGGILPVAEVAGLCRRHRAFLLVDAAQGAGLLEYDVGRDGIDAVALTGHKSLLGPQGTGALYLRDPQGVEPLLRGGTGSRSEEETQPGFPPDRFEAGTANVPGLAGLTAGVRYVRTQGVAALRERVMARVTRLDEGLRRLPGVTIHGPGDPGDRLGIVALTLDRRSTSDVARHLERDGVLCRPGVQCAPRAHRTLGTLPQGTVRLSVSGATTPDEVDAAVASVRGALAAG